MELITIIIMILIALIIILDQIAFMFANINPYKYLLIYLLPPFGGFIALYKLGRIRN